MRHPTTVYILRSHSQPERWYTGVTSDIGARLAAHNLGNSRHTATGRPWRLEVAVEFATADTAKSFELYLKSGSGRSFAQRHFRNADSASNSSS